MEQLSKLPERMRKGDQKNKELKQRLIQKKNEEFEKIHSFQPKITSK